MYPYSSLPANLAAFCDVLRRTHEFSIGPAELADAARAMELVAIGDQARVRDALRLVLSGRAEDVAIFDRAFDDFFFPARSGIPQEGLPDLEPSVRDSVEAPRAASEPLDSHTGKDSARDADSHAGTAVPVKAEDDGEGLAAPALRARASAFRVAGEAPILPRPEPDWHDAARELVRHVRLAQTRRWRSAARGPRFDLRRTLRASLHVGGEPLTPRWLARPRRAARFVVLIDGSRLMQACGEAPLQLATAMAAASVRVEVFTFSTTIRRVTAAARAARAGSQPLDALEDAWGGGTTIGACLRELLRTRGDRLLARDTCVVIVSDGLDAGDPAALSAAVRDIARRSAGIVWINPLAGTAGYEPTATGMRIALPHLAAFAHVDKASDLVRLAGTVRLRR